MITGVLMVVVGVAFWTTNGFVGTPALLPTSTQAWLQERSAVLAHPALDVIAILVAAVVVLLIWARLRKRHQPIRQEAARAAADQEDR